MPTPALPAPRVAVPDALAAHLLDRGPRPRLPQPRQVLRRHDPRASAGATSTSSTSSCARATRPRSRRVLEWAADANVAVIPYGGGTSVVGGVEPRIPGSFDGAVVARPRRARPRARGRPGLARGAHRRRRRRPAARGAARRARADAALLPAVLRALDARRLDRHARGRALRHRPDARRRPRRVGARDHARRDAGRRGGCPARAPARRPTGCCSARRGRSASSPRRGCACSRARRTGPGARCASPSFLAGAEAVRAVVQAGLRPANCRLLDALEARADRRGRRRARGARARLRVHRPRRSTTRSRARSSCAARTAAQPDEPAAGGGGAGAWREAFLRMPYLRDMLVRLGVLVGHLRDRDHVGPPARLPRGGRRRDARGAGRALPRDLPASRTSTPTARRPTSPSSRRRAAATSSSSGSR